MRATDQRTTHFIITGSIGCALMRLEQKALAFRAIGLYKTAELIDDCIADIRRDLRALEGRATKTALRSR